MGKVQDIFGNGTPGAISRSVDDIVISARNNASADVPFGAPVFLDSNGGAVPFDTSDPQEFAAFLGFAVRVADKTPRTYPQGQFEDPQAGAWHPGDVMEVLVRGGIAIPLEAAGVRGDAVYIRKADGKMTNAAGTSGSTVLLENVRVRNPRSGPANCAEVIVNERNII